MLTLVKKEERHKLKNRISSQRKNKIKWWNIEPNDRMREKIAWFWDDYVIAYSLSSKVARDKIMWYACPYRHISQIFPFVVSSSCFSVIFLNFFFESKYRWPIKNGRITDKMNKIFLFLDAFACFFSIHSFSAWTCLGRKFLAQLCSVLNPLDIHSPKNK